ncbi:MAG TPA: protein-disulfide reductase DsbD domain-containing protein [Candidatus Angelobacter sp.]|nr:protein-disulfide reductase DsbD domain-containing protein [Candidatus Angelobacter sp.]
MISACTRIAAGFLFLTVWFVPALAQQALHAQVELLGEEDAIVPGSDLHLGIHFVLKPGWHIYWINPGDSGQPPVVKWQLPSGFRADEIEWPRPERMQATSALADYGYHGEVLLPVLVHAPRAAAAGTRVAIAANAKWLICREVCIPEHAQLRLELPVAQSAKENRQSATLFANTGKLLPRPMPIEWHVFAKPESDDFILMVETGKPWAKAEFFPLEPNQIDNPAPQKLLPLPTGVKLVLKKSDLLTKPVRTLRGVLVLGDGAAYRIEAPVRQPIK